MQNEQKRSSEPTTVPVHAPPPDPQDPVSPVPADRVTVSQPDDNKAKVLTEAGKEGLKSTLSTIAIIIMAPIIAFTLTALVFQSYEVDGSSMETTLQNQDRLIVLKVPRTLAKLTGHAYIPRRGDVIIFNKDDLPEYGSTDTKRQLVKRVIGLPGDHITFSDGTIKVFNSAHPNGFDPDKTLSYGAHLQESINSTSCSSDYCNMVVPAGEVYVCGDNRNNSLDSRIFGPIRANDIVGKLTMRIYPFNKFEVF